MADEPSLENPPVEGRPAAYSGAALEGLVAMVPVIGNLLAPVLAVSLSKTQEDRMRRHLQLIGERIVALEAKVGAQKLIEAAATDQFAATFRRLDDAAARTPSSDKRERIANAIANALVWDPDRYRLDRLLDLVERLLPEHFVLLDFAASPRTWLDTNRPGWEVEYPAEGETIPLLIVRDIFPGSTTDDANQLYNEVIDAQIIDASLLQPSFRLSDPGVDLRGSLGRSLADFIAAPG